MNNLTPETLEFDPGRISIWSGWLVYDVGYHTCGGYGPESGYAHEPGCGAEPMCKVADIPALLAAAAERDALADEVADMVPRDWHGLMTILADVYPETAFPTLPDHEARDAGPRIVSLLRRVDALAAAVERVRALHQPEVNSTSALLPTPLCGCGVAWPCATIRALDATPETGGES